MFNTGCLIVEIQASDRLDIHFYIPSLKISYSDKALEETF